MISITTEIKSEKTVIRAGVTEIINTVTKAQKQIREVMAREDREDVIAEYCSVYGLLDQAAEELILIADYLEK